MQHFQTSFFYDLQELIRNAPLIRKYYYIFKSLNLSALKDRNDSLTNLVSAERLTFQRAMTKLTETLCPKTGSKA